MEDSKSEEITGRLENWSFAYGCLFGEIHDDTRKRWPNGRQIRTSYVADGQHALREGQVVVTSNSRYLLGKKVS